MNYVRKILNNELFTCLYVVHIPGIDKEMGPEEVPKSAFAGSERERCVQMEASCPVHITTQGITCSQKNHLFCETSWKITSTDKICIKRIVC